MKLTAEQIQENWNEFLSFITEYISEPRASELTAFYNKYAERVMLMPASHKKEYHNAFPGGYVEHVNRVIKAALKINAVWEEFGVEKNYTIEELVFSAMNHDLGKIGDEENESYIPQTDQWRKDKLGEDYTFNTKLEYMSVPDRGLYLLMSHGITYSKNEFLAIKLHDGLYDESHKKEYHNAFPGGYVEHVNRVIKAALKINAVWEEFGVEKNYTIEELVFSAMNHDLGKIGDEENESYIPQTDQWRKDKLGEDYTFNSKLEYMSVPDRGLYLLMSHGITYSKNEFLAIKLHDGLYDESNKPYLLSWAPETKVRTSLVHIIHQADFLAAKVEFEREWLPKFKGNLPTAEKNFTLNTKKNQSAKITTKTKALGTVKSEGLKNVMNDFFKD